ncbi:chromate transporter [Rubrivivax gelatinosus]|nr:chromate transporter [Rubrivivax gelatinosus]
MSLADWLHLLLFQLSLSLLAVGGAITLAPEMHRFLVQGQGWLSEAQFSASIALAQAAPGPNVLFIALLGWNVGVSGHGAHDALGLLAGLLGAVVCVVGVLTPSSLLTLLATRWCQRHRERLAVRAFRQGLSSLVVGVMLATSWLLARPSGRWREDGLLWLLTLVSALLVWRTRLHLLWLIAAGGVLGGLGLV